MSSPDAPFPPSSGEVDPADAAEQQETVRGDAPVDPPPAVPLEVSDADAVEQAAEPVAVQHRADREVPVDVPEADAVEQATVVHQDEDEHR